MSLDPDLLRLLRRFKLGPLASTLPERLALARAQSLDYAAFLTVVLADEVQRRDGLSLERKLAAAGFEERVALEDFDWTAPVQLDHRHLDQLFSLQFLARREHVIFVGPVAGQGDGHRAGVEGNGLSLTGHRHTRMIGLRTRDLGL